MKRFLSQLALALCISAAPAVGATVCEKMPRVTPAYADAMKVTGTLRLEEHWGPPNFGEQPATDAKYHFWVVKLDFPLTVNRDGQIVTTDRIQLDYGTRENFRRFGAFKDKHVAVTGRLENTDIGSTQVTPVQLANAVITTTTAAVPAACVAG
jgi:hypothetical protein